MEKGAEEGQGDPTPQNVDKSNIFWTFPLGKPFFSVESQFEFI